MSQDALSGRWILGVGIVVPGGVSCKEAEIGSSDVAARAVRSSVVVPSIIKLTQKLDLCLNDCVDGLLRGVLVVNHVSEFWRRPVVVASLKEPHHLIRFFGTLWSKTMFHSKHLQNRV